MKFVVVSIQTEHDELVDACNWSDSDLGEVGIWVKISSTDSDSGRLVQGDEL